LRSELLHRRAALRTDDFRQQVHGCPSSLPDHREGA
jgi:hypothetical protein